MSGRPTSRAAEAVRPGGRGGAAAEAPSVPPPGRRRPSAAGRRVEVGAAARRDAVADREALRQPEVLQLAHVELERRALAADQLGKVARAAFGMLVDQPERLAGPRAVGRRAVEAVEPLGDLRDLGRFEVAAGGQLGPRIGVGGGPELDAVRRVGGVAGRSASRLAASGWPAERASSSLMAAGSTTVTAVTSMRPAGVRYGRPGSTCWRAQRRNASVTVPSAMPAQKTLLEQHRISVAVSRCGIGSSLSVRFSTVCPHE